MSKRPKIKQEDGTLVDLPLDAETLQGKTLEEIALKTDIPTKTSELENDNGYTYFKTGINGYNVTEQWSNRSNYEFTLLEDGYYKATTENYGDMRLRSFVMCKVEFEVENECDVVIDYYSNSNKNKIFSIFSKLDTTLSQSYETTEDVDNIYHETSYIGISTMQGDSPNKIVYHNVSTGLHYIYVKFLNNSDNTFGGYDFKFKINEEETNSKLKKIITNGNNTIDISQFENCLKFKPLITNYNVINSGTNSNLIFSLTSDGYYKSEHEFEFRDDILISQGFVMCKVEFEVENECDVIIDIPNGNGGYYEASIGAIFSKLDTTLSKSYEITEDTDNIYQEVRDKFVKNVTYYNVSKGLHYIYIKVINSDEETGFTSYFKFKINEKSFKDINYITDETHHIDLEELKTEINNNLEELREDINNDLSKKQDKLQAGANVTIENNVISAKDTIVEFEKVDELPELTPELAKEKEHTVYSHNGSLYNISYNVGGYQEPLYLKDTYSVLPHKTNGGGCALVGTDIYIFGGYSYDENGAFTDYSIRKFDTINKTVTVLDVEIPDDINSGYGFEDCPVVAIGTDIYIIVDSSNGEIYKFDTINETLEILVVGVVGDYGYIRGVNTACAVNDEIYIIDNSGYINIFRPNDLIMIESDRYIRDDADMGGCLVKSVGDYVYVFGGLESNKIIKYSLDNYQSTIVGEFSEFDCIYDMSGVVFGTDIYIMGGEYNNKMYKFDTLTDTLTELDITLETEHNKDGCAIAINDHEFFLIGGDIGNDEKTNNIYHYSLTEDSEGATLEYQRLTNGGGSGASIELVATGTIVKNYPYTIEISNVSLKAKTQYVLRLWDNLNEWWNTLTFVYIDGDENQYVTITNADDENQIVKLNFNANNSILLGGSSLNTFIYDNGSNYELYEIVSGGSGSSGDYLPLSGGTMTGNIEMPEYKGIVDSSEHSGFIFYGNYPAIANTDNPFVLCMTDDTADGSEAHYYTFPNYDGEVVVKDEEGDVVLTAPNGTGNSIILGTYDTGVGLFPYVNLHNEDSDETHYGVDEIYHYNNEEGDEYFYKFPSKSGTIALTKDIVTESRVNELIAAYMTANYDNGDEGSY